MLSVVQQAVASTALGSPWAGLLVEPTNNLHDGSAVRF